MKSSRLIKLMMPAFALALLLVLVGCQADGQRTEATPRNPIQDEFAAGKDRVPTAQTLFAMARILEARNRDPQAEYVLNRVIEEHPDFLPAYNELAELNMRNNKTVQAIRVLERGLMVDAEHPALHNNLGVCAMMNEDYESAATHFAAAAELAPHVARYQVNLGVAEALMCEYDNAVTTMMGVLSEHDARMNVADICMANGDEQRAQQEMRLAEEARK